MSDDLAIVDPCPNCGTPVRRFQAVKTGPWWCSACLKARVVAAALAAARPIVRVML